MLELQEMHVMNCRHVGIAQQSLETYFIFHLTVSRFMHVFYAQIKSEHNCKKMSTETDHLENTYSRINLQVPQKMKFHSKKKSMQTGI